MGILRKAWGSLTILRLDYVNSLLCILMNLWLEFDASMNKISREIIQQIVLLVVLSLSIWYHRFTSSVPENSFNSNNIFHRNLISVKCKNFQFCRVRKKQLTFSKFTILNFGSVILKLWGIKNKNMNRQHQIDGLWN